MKKIIYFLAFLFIILSLVTCKKESAKTFISGIVIDRYSRQPIVEADIAIVKFKVGPSINIYDKHIEASLKTDVKGQFTYEYYPDPNYKYHSVEVQKTSECYGDEGVSFSVSPNKKNYLKIEKIATLTFKVHIKNIFPYDENDEMCFCFGKIPPQDCFSTAYAGTSIDNIIDYGQVSAHQYKYISWKLIKNNITTYNTDSIYLAPCDTVVYNLFY